jgi:hypothetical protein
MAIRLDLDINVSDRTQYWYYKKVTLGHLKKEKRSFVGLLTLS